MGEEVLEFGEGRGSLRFRKAWERDGPARFGMTACWPGDPPEANGTPLGFLQVCSTVQGSHRADEELGFAKGGSKEMRQQSESVCRGEMIVLDYGIDAG